MELSHRRVPRSGDPVIDRFKNDGDPDQEHHDGGDVGDSMVDDVLADQRPYSWRFGAGRINRNECVLSQVGNIDPDNDQDRLANQENEGRREHHGGRSGSDPMAEIVSV